MANYTSRRPSRSTPRTEQLEDRDLIGASTLDPTFSGDGLTTTNFAAGIDEVRGVAVQTDGKIVVVGRVQMPGNNDFGVARYNPNGTLDATFGLGGQMTTDFANGNDQAYAVVIQPDGKIVVAGFATDTTENFALARYNSNGTLDITFNNDGKLMGLGFGGHDRAYAVALQADGKIVAAGVNNLATNPDFVVARYTANGMTDLNFGAGAGFVATDFANHDEAHAVVVQPDGKIVAAGTANHNINPDFAIARYNSDGTLDNGFSSGGKNMTDLGGVEGGNAMALQPNGRIVVSGYTSEGSGDFATVRYLSSGVIDLFFGTGSKVVTDFGGEVDRANGVALRPDGKIVVVGLAGIGGSADFGVAQYNADGSPDASFAPGSKTTADLGVAAYANAVALQGDGRIVAGGYANLNGGDFAVARFGDAPMPKVVPPPMSVAPLADFTAHVTLTRSKLRFNPRSGRYRQRVTIRNVSNSAILGPMHLVFDGLRRGIQLFRRDGVTLMQSPLGSSSRRVFADGALRVGESVTLTLEFTNPRQARVRYSPRVLAGAGLL